MLRKYQHTSFTWKPNKREMQPTEWAFTDMNEFNEVYQYCKENFMKVEPTKSGSMPYNRSVKLHSRYMVITSKTKIELTVVCHLGCYRFLIGNKRDEITNPVSGRDSIRAIYNKAEEMNIDLTKYACSEEEGEAIKATINPPHIEAYCQEGRVYTNVHHLDLNSSYASRISEEYPELKPLYENMYNKRNENDGFYKHVLTNSIGCMQSEFCVDLKTKFRSKPYQFAKLAKIAVNNTRRMIEDYIDKLTASGRKVLLTNTDGIWYQGDIFTDENNHANLGGWKTDHKNCKFIIKSKGAYQFIEDDVVHTVVRGTTLLDKEKPREDWKFGEIFNNIVMEYYTFDEEKGVVKHGEKL